MDAIALRFEAYECMKRVLRLEAEIRTLRLRAATATREADHLEVHDLRHLSRLSAWHARPDTTR